MSRRPRLGLLAVAAGLLLVAGGAVAARARPISNIPELILAVGAPFTSLAAVTALIIAALCRRAFLSIVAVAVLTATLTVQVTWYHLGSPPPPHVGQYKDIRVLSSNLRKGLADPGFVVDLANANADVITVAELTPEAVQRLRNAGIDRAFRYSHLIPAPGSSGTGMWSRYPLSALSVPRHRGVHIPAALLEVPGMRFEPLLSSVHVYSPVAGERSTVGEWRGGMAGAKVQLDSFARIAGPGAVIVGGDYNSTPDMRQFRDLLSNGYRDAVEQTGSGFMPTFPSNEWFPPLITIDHVLTRGAAASSVRTIEVPGSDHRALLVTIRVPLDPTAS